MNNLCINQLKIDETVYTHAGWYYIYKEFIDTVNNAKCYKRPKLFHKLDPAVYINAANLKCTFLGTFKKTCKCSELITAVFIYFHKHSEFSYKILCVDAKDIKGLMGGAHK